MFTRASPNNLSARERAVLHLLAQGHQNKEIARALGVTTGTAECHVHSILKKLGVTTRLQAVLVATREDLLGESVAE